MRFEVWRNDDTLQYYWRLRANNGTVLAVSRKRGYLNRVLCDRAIRSVARGIQAMNLDRIPIRRVTS